MEGLFYESLGEGEEAFIKPEVYDFISFYINFLQFSAYRIRK